MSRKTEHDLFVCRKESRTDYKNGKSLILYKSSGKWIIEKVFSDRDSVQPTGAKAELPIGNADDVYSIETNSDYNRILVVYRQQTTRGRKTITENKAKIFDICLQKGAIKPLEHLKSINRLASDKERGSLVCAKWAPYSPNVVVFQYKQKIYVDEVKYNSEQGKFILERSDKPIIETDKNKSLHAFTWVDQSDIWLKYAIWCPFDLCIKTPIIPEKLAIPADEYTRMQLSLTGPYVEKLAKQVKREGCYEIFTRGEHPSELKFDGLKVDDKDPICSVEFLGSKIIFVRKTGEDGNAMSVKWFNIPGFKSPVYNELCFVANTDKVQRAVDVEFVSSGGAKHSERGKKEDKEDIKKSNEEIPFSYRDSVIWKNGDRFWISVKTKKDKVSLYIFKKGSLRNWSYSPFPAEGEPVNAAFGKWAVRITDSGKLEKSLIYSSQEARDRVRRIEERRNNLLVSMAELQSEVNDLKKMAYESVVDVGQLREDAEKMLEYLEKPFDFEKKADDIRRMENGVKERIAKDVKELEKNLHPGAKGQDVASILESFVTMELGLGEYIPIEIMIEKVLSYLAPDLRFKSESDGRGCYVNVNSACGKVFISWELYVNGIACLLVGLMARHNPQVYSQLREVLQRVKNLKAAREGTHLYDCVNAALADLGVEECDQELKSMMQQDRKGVYLRLFKQI